MKTFNVNINWIIISFMLIALFLFSTWTRSGTLSSKVILDYDPWYYYRLAKDILENNLKRPEWDIETFFPPGRPFEKYVGWEYIIIFFYKVLSIFKSSFTLMEAAKLSPMITVGFASIAAFFLGKLLTDKWGGLATGIFAVSTPTFIGVSMAGYCDADAIVVFYSFLCIFSMIMALKKNKIQYYIIALILNVLFIYNWFFGLYLPFFFLLFIPTFIGYKIFENFIYDKKINLTKIWKDVKNMVVPIFIFIIVLNIILIILGLGNIIDFIKLGLGFTAGSSTGEIVNVSVAELQPINIFKIDGIRQVLGRIGLIPGLLFVLGLPTFVIYKFIKKEKIEFVEIFLFMWAALTFYLILNGVRFSLLFSCAAATAAGYVVGNLKKNLKLSLFILFFVFLGLMILQTTDKMQRIYLLIPAGFCGLLGILINSDSKEDEKRLGKAVAIGCMIILVLLFIDETIAYANQASGMEVGQNWIDMLDWLNKNAKPKAMVATWWDPGHIIAGYTGLFSHADGAHCAAGQCIPYPHDIRIQDMGRMMTTNNETESIELLKKYTGLSKEDCDNVKKIYGGIVPEEACEPVSEMYFIASSDLIGKFTWMDYFGGFRAPIDSSQTFEKNPGICCPSTPKTEPGQMSCGEFASQGKGVWVWCPWIFSFQGQQQDQQGNPVYVYDYGGLKMAILQRGNQTIPVYNNKYVINNMIFYNNGLEQVVDFSDANVNLEKIDGLVWVDPSFTNLIYFAPSIKDSIFTKLFFFNGKGLEHFELVYSNSEIKLFKVKF